MHDAGSCFLNWRLFLMLAGLLGVLAAQGAPALAQTPVPAPAATTFSQALRAQGHNLSDAEVAFLDSDEQIQANYIQALVNIDLLSRVDAERRTDSWRQAVLSELNRILAQDPAAAPPAPPSLEQFRELAVAYRRDVFAAASKWLEAMQANDPEWLQRGTADYSSSLQRLSAMQQELANRYPAPQSSGSQ